MKISVTAVKQQSSQTEREPKSDTFYTYASTLHTAVVMYIPRNFSKSNNLLFCVNFFLLFAFSLGP